jgi:hypothetical protein
LTQESSAAWWILAPIGDLRVQERGFDAFVDEHLAVARMGHQRCVRIGTCAIMWATVADAPECRAVTRRAVSRSVRFAPDHPTSQARTVSVPPTPWRVKTIWGGTFAVVVVPNARATQVA